MLIRIGQLKIAALLLILSPLFSVFEAGAISYHWVGKVEQGSSYGSGQKVSHPDVQFNGQPVKDGSRYVWQSAVNPPVDSWMGPGLTVSKGATDNQLKRYQKACFVLKSTSGSHGANLIVSGKKSSAAASHTIKAVLVAVSSGSYGSYCVMYTLVGGYSDLQWNVYVQDGQIRIDRVDLYQAGFSKASIIDEIAAKPNG